MNKKKKGRKILEIKKMGSLLFLTMLGNIFLNAFNRNQKHNYQLNSTFLRMKAKEDEINHKLNSIAEKSVKKKLKEEIKKPERERPKIHIENG